MSKNSRIYAFISSQSISLLGSSIVQYAIIWNLVLERGSGSTLAFAAVSGFIPQALAGVAGSFFIDRFRRKTLLIFSDLVTAVAALCIVLLRVNGVLSDLLLFLLLAVRSFCSGIQTPLVNTSIPLLSDKKDLLRVNGALSTANSVTTLLSPAIGAFLLGVMKFEYVLLCDVVTAVIAVTVTSFIRFDEEDRANADEKVTGFAFLKGKSELVKLMVYQTLLFFLISPTAFMTPLFVSRYFSAEYAYLSLSEMTYSIGMIAGGLVVQLIAGRKYGVKMLFLSGAFYGVMMCCLGLSRLYPIYLVFNCLIGISSPVYTSLYNSALQEKSEDSYRGRLFSLSMILTSVALPLGMLVFGFLADTVSLGAIFDVAGLLVVLLSLIVKGNYCKNADYS